MVVHHAIAPIAAFVVSVCVGIVAIFSVKKVTKSRNEMVGATNEGEVRTGKEHWEERWVSSCGLRHGIRRGHGKYEIFRREETSRFHAASDAASLRIDGKGKGTANNQFSLDDSRPGTS